MKKPLILLAAMTIGGAAIAQNQPMTPPAAMTMPGDAAPPVATPPMMPSAADPAPMATPMPPMASPAPMASDAPMQAPMAAPSTMPMGASADTSSYPVCSRTVQDKCRNRGGR